MKKRAVLTLIILLSFMIVFADPDEYEPDNSFSESTPLPTNNTAQTHSFSPAEDEDFFNFSARSGTKYIIETFNLTNSTDTMIYLYNSNQELVDSNDDIVLGLIRNSRIIWESENNQNMFIKAKDWNSSYDNGIYSIRVNEYPAIQELSCKNNSEWIECEDIKFGFNITKIRVNCTYYDQ
ncbi:hypothetical protein GF327_05505, partial [Candidatus Woesearchaeota archaeon]|nr:hypothetical protein [Candidatus Woesearchaeota archaeon]